MYHSITFDNDKNTWDDWFLIPTSRPVINPPEVKTNYVEIPGSNKVLDLTETLTSGPMYKYREGSIEFIVDNDHKSWASLYTEIMEYLHGKKRKAILEDDPNYYYEGRFAVNQWKSESYYSKITLDYYLFPFKMDTTDKNENWLWNPFHFKDGVIRTYKNLSVNGTYDLSVVVEGEMMFMPIIESNNNSVKLTIISSDWSYTTQLVKGENKIYEKPLVKGNYTFRFTGTGIVTLQYRGGTL